MRKNKRTDKEMIAAVYNDLRNNHLGEENAISRAAFCADHGLSARDLRAICEHINSSKEFEGLVSVSKNIYLCNDKRECIRAIGLTYAPAFTLLRKARKMEEKLKQNGQMILTAEDRKEIMTYWFDREKGEKNETDDVCTTESD